MNFAVVGLGSNIDPEMNIKKAKQILAWEQILIDESDTIITKPLGYLDQPDFQNGAVLIKTDWEIDRLKDFLKELENRLGRIRGENKNGPRTIDLDILVWNSQIIDPDVYKRSFLRKLILQLLPDIELK